MFKLPASLHHPANSRQRPDRHRVPGAWHRTGLSGLCCGLRAQTARIRSTHQQAAGYTGNVTSRSGNCLSACLGPQCSDMFRAVLVQTGRHGCGNRERPPAHLEGCDPARRKESLHQGTKPLLIQRTCPFCPATICDFICVFILYGQEAAMAKLAASEAATFCSHQVRKTANRRYRRKPSLILVGGKFVTLFVFRIRLFKS